MKTFQAICLLALSKLAFGQLQKPLNAAIIDDIAAHETQSSEPPAQTEPPYEDPFEKKGTKLIPAVLDFLALAGEPDEEERHVTDADEDFTTFPQVEMDYATYRATKYNVSTPS